MDTISHTTTALPALADRAQRYDGWTPDRQRAFLEAVAEGHTVGSACALVGMAPSSAYALRRRAAGAGFALGWRAANLLAREKVADTLLARAIDGQVETVTRANGETLTRHRYDNRLASTMLARLDRFADKEAGEATHQAARLVAAEFDGFLDLIERDEGPARAGLFLGTRIADDEGDPDLGAIVSLARADRWLRSGHGSASEVDTHDLDPDARTGWTAEQWVRAEAAGMVAFAAPAEPARHSPLSPLHPGDGYEEEGEDVPVWYDECAREWRTSFAPPDHFYGDEEGEFGDEDYSRTLTPVEEEAVEARHRARLAVRCTAGAAERDAWFAALSEASDGASPEAATAPEAMPPDDAAAPDRAPDIVTGRRPDMATMPRDNGLSTDHPARGVKARPADGPGGACREAATVPEPMLRNGVPDQAPDMAAPADPMPPGNRSAPDRPAHDETAWPTSEPGGVASGNGIARVSFVPT